MAGETESAHATKSKSMLAIVMALLVAPWTFVGICWTAFLIAKQVDRPLTEIPSFWLIAIAVVIAALVVSTTLSLFILRLINERGQRNDVNR